jgi:membrane fusion protein
MTEEPESLFRPEVFEARKRRVYGDVVIRQSTSAWVLGSLFGGLLLLGLVALAFGTYARTETVQGILVPGGGSAKVLPRRAGVVARVFVREGQEVKAGTPLALVRVDQTLPGGGTLEEMQRSILREQQGIAGDQIGHAVRDLRQKEASAAARLAGLRSAIENTREQLQINAEIVRSARAQFEVFDKMAAQRLVRQSELEERRRAYLNAESQQRSLQKESDRLTSEIREVELDRGMLGEQTREAIRQLESRKNETELRLVALQGASTFLLTAPIAGKVAGLQANVGQAASPGQPVLTILPAGADLRAHLVVPSRSAGFLRAGQPVRIRYDAFPYQQFGTFEGTIAEVSQNILAPSEVSLPVKVEGPVYRVIVTLKDQSVNAYGRRMPLTPGLALTSSIVLERRSLLDVLLDPVRAVRARD